MISGGLESVLIGDPGDGVGHSIVLERIGSTCDGAAFLTDQFLRAGLFNFDLVLSFEAVNAQQSDSLHERDMGESN